VRFSAGDRLAGILIRAMNVRQADLVRLWGLSPGNVSNLVRKGMPLTSVDEAMRWRLTHRRGAKLGGKGIPVAKPIGEPKPAEVQVDLAAPADGKVRPDWADLSKAEPPPPRMPKPPAPPAATNGAARHDPTDAEDQTLESVYRRCQAAEMRAFDAMEATLLPNSTTADQFKTYLAAHAQSVSARLRVERQIKDEALNSRTLIQYDEAIRQFMGVMGPLRTLIDGLPRVCGPRCNPSDPQLATQILAEWVENSFLKVLSHGEAAIINSENAGS